MRIKIQSPIEKLDFPFLKEKQISLFLKRDDLIHPIISGNKWRKLKYNLSKAISENHSTILTFGGTYSNHLHATAYACKENYIKSIGIIRGTDSDITDLNQTLTDCQNYGMQLHFISREDYKRKNEKDFIDELKNKFSNFYLIPEGGANYEGILGCKEILGECEEVYDYVCCAAGTGTTLTGLLLSLRENEILMGFPALKNGEFINEEVKKNIQNYFPQEIEKIKSLELNCDYHFGGYAKVNDDLKNFVADFFSQTNIQLDLIYNGKMMYGLFDLIKKGHFEPGTRILAIHTGGMQGNRGFLG